HDREQRQLYRRSERRSSDRLHPLELMSPSTQRRALDGGVDELELRDGAMDAARCPLVEPPEEEAPGNLPELAVQRQLREKYDVGSEVTALESGPTQRAGAHHALQHIDESNTLQRRAEPLDHAGGSKIQPVVVLLNHDAIFVDQRR